MLDDKDFSRSGATAQRQILILRCAVAPLREKSFHLSR